MKNLELALSGEQFKNLEANRYPEFYIKLDDEQAGEFCLFNRFRNFDTVTFRRLYSREVMSFEFRGVSKGFGKTGWGAPADFEVFIICLGKRVEGIEIRKYI